MAVLLQGSAAAPCRLEFPTSWPDDVTAVTYTIRDARGDTLVAATAATVPAADALTAAADVGDTEIGLNALVPAAGDVLRIKGATTRAEDVKAVGVAAYVVSLARDLRYDHGMGAAVRCRFATATVDTTDADVWTPALRAIVTWQPNTATPAHTEEVIVRPAALAIAGLRETFDALYPDEYRLAEERWAVLEQQAVYRVGLRARAAGRFIDALKAQKELEPIMLDTIRLSLLTSAAGRWEDRIPQAERQLAADWAAFDAAAAWFDDNHDDAEGPSEIGDAGWRPTGRGW